MHSPTSHKWKCNWWNTVWIVAFATCFCYVRYVALYNLTQTSECLNGNYIWREYNRTYILYTLRRAVMCLNVYVLEARGDIFHHQWIKCLYFIDTLFKTSKSLFENVERNERKVLFSMNIKAAFDKLIFRDLQPEFHVVSAQLFFFFFVKK